MAKKKIHLKNFLSLCDRYTCKFQWDDRYRASGYCEITFLKIVRSQKKLYLNELFRKLT
jgi:hypothetical protein